MTWSVHVYERLKKTNKAIYLLRRNVVPKFKVSYKLGLYKSTLLRILLYGMNCVRLNRGSTRNFKSFQKRALNWECYDPNWSYLQQLRLLKLLILPRFMQCNIKLLMYKLFVEGGHDINIPTFNPESGRSTMFFKLNRCKKQKTRGEFVYWNCRVINRINKKNSVGQHWRSIIANIQPDLEVCRHKIFWFQSLDTATMLPLLWKTQHSESILIRSNRKNPFGGKPQKATTTTTTNYVTWNWYSKRKS